MSTVEAARSTLRAAARRRHTLWTHAPRHFKSGLNGFGQDAADPSPRSGVGAKVPNSARSVPEGYAGPDEFWVETPFSQCILV